MSETKIDKATAETEFERYCEANDIDCDIASMSEEDRKDFEPIKKRFIKACMEGRVVVDDRNITYTNSALSLPAFQEAVIISPPSGSAFMAMDGYKDSQAVHKLQSFISAMTGKDIKYFAKLDRKDWLFYRDIATLFLAA